MNNVTNNRLEAIKSIKNEIADINNSISITSLWSSSVIAEHISNDLGISNVQVHMRDDSVLVKYFYNGNTPSNVANSNTWRTHDINIYARVYDNKITELDLSWFSSIVDLMNPSENSYVIYLRIAAYLAEQISDNKSELYKHVTSAISKLTKMESVRYSLYMEIEDIKREIYEDIRTGIDNSIESAITKRETVDIKPYRHKGSKAEKMTVINETAKFITFALFTKDGKLITQLRRNRDNFISFVNSVWKTQYDVARENAFNLIKSYT